MVTGTRNFIGVVAILLTMALLMGPRAVHAQSTFDAGGDGTTWEDPLNWNPNGLPAGNVNINALNVVELSTSQSIAELDITGDQGIFDGTLNQTGGTLTGSGWLKVGFGLSDTGNYNLSNDAAATGYDNFFLGRDDGVGNLSISDTASVTANFIELGSNSGTGNATITGGSLNSNGNINHVNGVIDVSGTGQVNVAQFNIGFFNSGGTGTANFSGTSSIVATNEVKVGDGGTGVLNLSGSASINSNNTSVRFGDGGGTGTLSITDSASVDAGSGDFAFKNNSTGTINTSGAINAGQYILENTATVDHSAGDVTANNWVSIGNAAGETATYNLTGGSVTSNADWVSVGENGGGDLNVSGSSSVAANGNGLIVGRNGTGDGLLSLDGSAASLSATELRAGLNGDPVPLAGGASEINWIADATGITTIDAGMTALMGTVLDVDLTAWSQFADIGAGSTPLSLTLIDNATAATTGTFDTLAEGATVDIGGGKTGTISYVGGGDSLDVTLTVLVSSVPGDFDGDGDVDVADALLGQRNGENLTPGNPWNDNFGTGSAVTAVAAVSAVPEPTVMAMAALGAGFATLSRYRRRRHG